MTTNSQINDSVRLSHLFTINAAPAQTQAMLSTVMAATVGMGMHNAISAQRNSQILASAAVASTCARLLSAPPVPALPRPKPPASVASAPPPSIPAAPLAPAVPPSPSPPAP